MRKVLMPFSITLLVLLLAAAVAYARGSLSEAANKQIMLLAGIGWFLTAPFWMKSSGS